jgi:hypothetical protein
MEPQKIIPTFTSALVWYKCSASCFSRFNRETTAHGKHCIGSWVFPRDSMIFVEKIIVPLPCPGIEARLLGCPTRSSVTIPTELLRLSVATLAYTASNGSLKMIILQAVMIFI